MWNLKLVTTAGETIDEDVGFGELQFSTEEVRAVVETAHAAGKPVCTHTGTAEGVEQAVAAGVDCIEHGYVLDERSVERRPGYEEHMKRVPSLIPRLR